MAHSGTSRASQPASFTLADLAARVNGALVGDGAFRISSVAPLESAASDQLSFWLEPKMEDEARRSSAGALVVPNGQTIPGKNVIQVTQPREALAIILALFADPVTPVPGVHAQAVVDPGARIGKNVSISALAYIGPHVVIGDDAVIYPNVTILPNTTIGNRVVIHSGTVIGSDGFGFVPVSGKWVKIPQIGGVTIGDDVEIQGNCVIDRGTMGDTQIGDGTKIDNLVHIAHNVKIGKHCAITAQAGIAGSATIGDYVASGGQIGIGPGITVGDKTEIAAQAGISSDVPAGSRIAGYLAQDIKKEFRAIALMRRLPELFKRVNDLESNASKK